MQLNPLEELIAQIPIWFRLLIALLPASGLALGVWAISSSRGLSCIGSLHRVILSLFQPLAVSAYAGAACYALRCGRRLGFPGPEAQLVLGLLDAPRPFCHLFW